MVSNRLFGVKGFAGLILIGTVALGIFFRFANLDLPIFWVDEVITTAYSYGYSEQDIGEQVQTWQGRAVSRDRLLQFQMPDAEKGAASIVQSLAEEEPISPPLYYLLLHGWTQLFGHSVWIRRSLSAGFGVLAIAALYWLCWELFGVSITSRLATAFFALSPFFVLYAREVRYYSLWTLLTILSSAILLWAVRRNKLQHWLVYSLTLAASLYTYPFAAMVAIAHGIYVLSVSRCRLTKTSISYAIGFASARSAIAAAVAVLLFLPWGWQILFGSYETSDWRKRLIPFSGLLTQWMGNIKLAFLDFGSRSLHDPPFIHYGLSVAIALLALVALIYLGWRSPRPIGVLILGLVLLPWLSLAIPDLVLGGIRSIIPRYLVPAYLGVQIAIAYWLAAGIGSSKMGRRRLASGAAIFLICLEVFSCTRIVQSQRWWTKSSNLDLPDIARIVNLSPNPLVVSRLSGDGGRSVIALAYFLKTDAQLSLVYDKTDIPEIPRNFQDLFLFGGSEELRQKLAAEQNLIATPLYQGRRSLWQLQPTPNP